MNQEEARREVLKQTLQLTGNNWLLELSTGVGKSKLAIDKIKSVYNNDKTLLIVIPRKVLKENWMKEINIWWKECPLDIVFTTYISLHKHMGKWDYVIYDEAHHITERCVESIQNMESKHSVLLTATVNKSLRDKLYIFNNLQTLKVDLRKAIDNNILPDPRVYLIPLYLKDDFPTEVIWRNKKAKGTLISCSWSERWNYIKQKSFPVKIYCTEKQYIDDLNGNIEWYKKRYMRSRNEGTKARWLRLCSERLLYLSNKKTQLVSNILKGLESNRTLTFCNGILQTEALGKYCINSKNKLSEKYLSMFNEGKIKHITACNMINEGCNLTDCQVGIYANLNSSETIIAQRTGRLLRHRNPVIIIPYYKDTREEELVDKMLENYNRDLIKEIQTIEEITI